MDTDTYMVHGTLGIDKDTVHGHEREHRASECVHVFACGSVINAKTPQILKIAREKIISNTFSISITLIVKYKPSLTVKV